MSRQTRLGSLVEAIANTALGLVIAFAAQSFIAWVYGIKLTPHENAILVWWMTVISVMRSYVVRRLWNAQFWKRWRNGD